MHNLFNINRNRFYLIRELLKSQGAKRIKKEGRIRPSQSKSKVQKEIT